jgi:hypothetical protein
MTPEEYEKLKDVELLFPLTSAVGDPLYFISYIGPDSRPKISLSILSVKFFDDLCIADAWLWVNGYSTNTIIEYISALKYKQAKQLPYERFPPPLVALQIPESALDDPNVDTLSQELLKSAITWIIAHHLGHIYLSHHSNSFKKSALQHRRELVNADAFATEIMRRSGVAPLGMLFYFEILAYYEPNRFDFADEMAWLDYQSQATHPLSRERLDTLAKYLKDNASDFTRYETDKEYAEKRILFMGDQIRLLGTSLEDKSFRASILSQALKADIKSFSPRREIVERESASEFSIGITGGSPLKAVVVYSSPKSLKIGDTYEFRAALGTLKCLERLKNLVGQNIPFEMREVESSDLMEVKIISEGMLVTSITPEKQMTKLDEPTIWKWEIKAVEGSNQRVHLTLNTVGFVKGKEFPRSIHTQKWTISVHTSLGQHMIGFIRGNWQWLWAAIIVPIATWIWKRKKRSGKQ